ncbi:hypothetical protein F0562_009631 [Nyssa sinensis]|uniref:Transcription factor n=1 Tax=Nyssa sinensis TaxID=561372 RepID=A0A5J4ZZT7_9ASTE|nr:hypothetical protein F0562_009631 [Nyssa sinensis]
MGRAPCCDKSKVKRGPWSPEEDTTLKNYIERYGTGGNWIALPHKAGLKRCGKSCRLRWLNYLRPDIRHGGFTEEEDNIILTLYSSIGSRWSIIATHLQGRTDNDVKNYWNTKLKKKLLAGKTNSSSSSSNCNITPNNSMHFSSAPSWAFGSKVETHYYANLAGSNTNSNSLPCYQMNLNYQQHFVPQTLVLDPVQLPLPRLMEVDPEKGTSNSSFSVASSQEVSSISTLFSSWSGNGSGREDHDGFLMDSGSGFPYDILNGFDFQENTGEVYPN